MTRKSCYKPIKAFIYIEFLAYDEDAMGNLITTNLAFRELENEAVETINVFAGLNIQPDEEKEVTDMCKAWDDHYRSGVQQGEHAKRIEAIENMILLGLTKEKILTKYSEELGSMSLNFSSSLSVVSFISPSNLKASIFSLNLV